MDRLDTGQVDLFSVIMNKAFGAALPPLTPDLDKLRLDGLTLQAATKRNYRQLGLLFKEIQDTKKVDPDVFWDTYVVGEVHAREARIYLQLALAYSPAAFDLFPLDDLLLMLRYCRANDLTPLRDPGPQIVTFKQKDGTVFAKPFSECTRQDLEAALGQTHKPRPPHKHDDDDEKDAPNMPPEALKLREKFLDLVDKRVGPIWTEDRGGPAIKARWDGQTDRVSIVHVANGELRDTLVAMLKAMDDFQDQVEHDWKKGHKGSL